VAGDGAVVVDVLARLVDKSLVVAQGQGPDDRFRMLEVVRAYALERLVASGTADEVARRHARVCLAAAQAASRGLAGAREAEGLARFDAEHDNMRAALAWLREHDPDGCLDLAVELSGYWSLHGYFAEGVEWLTAALEASDPAPSPARAMAFRASGELAWRKGDLAVARALIEESMRLAVETGVARQIAWSNFHLALVIQMQGDARGSCPYLEESLARAREIGDERLVGNALNSLGEAARMDGDWGRARSYYEESLASHRRMGHSGGGSLTLCNLGAALVENGDAEAAMACYHEALPHLRELGNWVAVSLGLDGLAAIAAARGEWERAARLAGAAEALRDASGAELEPADRSLRERCLHAVQAHLDEAAFEAATAVGRATARDRAIDEALAG
jgi:non-specific serine/threonine protein kinase